MAKSTRPTHPFLRFLLALGITCGILFALLYATEQLIVQQIEAQLSSALEVQAQSAAITFKDMKLDILDAEASVKEAAVSLQQEDLELSLGTASVRVIPSEAVSLLLDRSEGSMSQVQLDGTGVNLVSAGTVNLKAADALVTLSGDVSPSSLSDGTALVRQAALSMNGVTLADTAGSVEVRVPSLEVSAVGDLGISPSSPKIADLAVRGNDVGVSLKEMGISSLSSEIIVSAQQVDLESLMGTGFEDQPFQMLLSDTLITLEEDFYANNFGEILGMDPAEFLPGELEVESLTAEVTFRSDGLSLRQLDIASSLIDGSGTLEISYAEDGSLSETALAFTVEELSPELDAVLSLYAFFMGMQLPNDRDYTLEYVMDENGVQEFSIR